MQRKTNVHTFSPQEVYKNKGWKSWSDFLSSNIISNHKKSFLNFEEAKMFVQKLGLSHKFDYLEYINKNNISFLPKRPESYYKDDWSGYLEYLNCCSIKSSYGEKKVKEYLENKNIKFIREKKFDTCKSKKNLPFDFYLPEYNACIEYDGEHHYKPVSKYGGVEFLEKVQENDRIKTDWCLKNNIKLIRISYRNKNKIFKILDENLLLN